MAFIRAREIEGELRNRGHERGTLYVLQVLAEQQIALQKDMRDLADIVNKVSDIAGYMVQTADNMKDALTQLRSEAIGEDDGLDRNTQALGQKE